MESFIVVGNLEIAGRIKGETVQLDPAVVNVDALIDGGLIIRTDQAAYRRARSEPATAAEAEETSG